MEEDKNFYNRKKRFLLSDKDLADHSSEKLKPTQINLRIALNKLPDEIQALVHKKEGEGRGEKSIK